MSLAHSGIQIVCDRCGRRRFHSTAHTGHGARGEAERHGWLVSYLAGGQHPTKRSNDPRARDMCPDCRPQPPTPDGALI